MGLQTTTSTLLDALCNGDALNGNGYEFFSQATLEKLSQGNDWAGSQHWKKTEHFRRKHVETKDSPKQKRKKASKERVFVDLSVPVCLDDILQPAKKNNRGTDPIQLSKAMITKYTKCHNLLPPDAGIGLKELSTLFMRPNAIVRANVELPDRGGKTVGFHNTVDTFADGSGFDDGESWGGGEDDGQGFTLTEDDNHGDNFVVKELEGVRKVQKTRVGYATVAKIVDVKRLKKDLWTELESTLVPVVEESEIGEETNHTGGDIKPPEEEGHKKLSFNNTVAEMSVSQSQNDVTLPFYFICLLHLANEKGLRLESQGLEDFFICVDDGAEPSVGFLPDIASAPRAARKKGKAAIVESEDEGGSDDNQSDDDN
jgi:condensin complex subunit 2